MIQYNDIASPLCAAHESVTDYSIMSITFSCPNPTCRAKMTVPDSVAGKRGKCTKCQKLMTVPPETEPPVAPARAAVPPPPPRVGRPVAPKVPAPVMATVTAPPPTEEPPVDEEAAARDVFSDGPEEAAKATEFIEFNCPQCDEPLKMPLEMGGKRGPCPECRRIIAVPMPKQEHKASWRDTGPNLPSGARREEQAAPEGAWEGKSAAVGTEALQEAGVIQEKRKPLTLLQKTGPYIVLGTPVLVVVFGGFFLWQYFTRASEKKALDTALSSAKSDVGRKALKSDGLIAVHGYAGKYYLRSQVSGSARLASEQFGKARSIAASGHTLAGDALVGEIALAELDLAGTPEEIDADRKLKWPDTQRIIKSTLAAIHSRSGKLAGLRGVVGGLVSHERANAVLPMTSELYPTTGADRSEAFAVAGLELLRLGKKADASNAYAVAEAPFADKKTRPALPAAVVALAVALERNPPAVVDKDNIGEDQQRNIGMAEGRARLGKLAEARQAAKDVGKGGDGARFNALVALVDGAYSTKQGEAADLDAALAAVSDGAGRPSLAWVYLRLVELALDADIDVARIEPVIAAIADPHLRDWARLLVYRKHLKTSKAIEGDAGLGGLSPKTLGGLVARLEMAWHNTRRDGSWGKVVNTWDEAPKATGSLGVALGMQGK